MQWILISVVILLVALGILSVVVARKTKRKTDYYSFFVMGLIWTAFGIFAWIRYNEYNALFAIGVVFLVLGLIHKKEWKKNHRTWKQMDKKEKKLMGIVMGVLLLLVVLGGLAFYAVDDVDSFEECVEKTGVVMESYPRQCRYNDEVFVEEIENIS